MSPFYIFQKQVTRQPRVPYVHTTAFDPDVPSTYATYLVVQIAKGSQTMVLLGDNTDDSSLGGVSFLRQKVASKKKKRKFEWYDKAT